MKKALRVSTAFSLAGLLAISSLMSPVNAAYAANGVQSMDVASDVVLAGDGVASRVEDSAGGDAAANQSPSTDVDDSTEGDFRADASVDERQVEPSDSSFQYVYLAYPNLPGGTDRLSPLLLLMMAMPLLPQTLNYISADGVRGTVDTYQTLVIRLLLYLARR